MKTTAHAHNSWEPYNNPTVNYGQLVTILGSLGYGPDATRSGEGYVVFAHAGPGRTVTLPVYADHVAMPTMYLNAIRGGLKISLPDEVAQFDRLLSEAGSRLLEGVPVA